MNKDQYQTLINSVSALRGKMIENIHLSYILPYEIEAIKALGIIPKESPAFFSRSQAISLLAKLTIGIKLEMKATAIDK